MENNSRSLLTTGFALLFLAATWSLFSLPVDQLVSDTPPPEVNAAETAGFEQKGAIGAFRTWLASAEGRDVNGKVTAEVLSLAMERKAQMLELMKTAPVQALAASVSFAEWESLPAALKSLVEQPFSAPGEWRVLPDCAAGGEGVREVLLGNETFAVKPYGRWLAALSKKRLPLTGIRLEGVAALHDSVFQPIGEGDRVVADRLFSEGERKSALTGAPISSNPIATVAGGRKFYFATEEERLEAERQLLEADAMPGPDGGSGYVLAADGADAADGGGVVGAAVVRSRGARSTWTETPKNVLLLLVDFSDLTGDPVDRSVLSAVTSGEVKTQIRNMSYQKTTVNVTLAAPLIRMPQVTAAYLPSNTSMVLSDAKAAAQTLGVSLAGYDIIGVVFADIDMTSGGGGFAGLASVGGGDFWLQGSTGEKTITHEFGHNYGLNHSGFWQTSDGSVVGTGGNVEYGDGYDIMGSGSLPVGHFHMEAKRRLNWISATDGAQISTSGTYRVFKVDDALATGRRGLKIAKTGGEFYWVGYRGADFDNVYLRKGALLMWERPSFSRSFLLDTSPGTVAGKLDAGLPLGKTYSDTSANVHITPISQGGSGAGEYLDVVVQFGPFPANTAPTGSITGPTSVAARTSVLFSANVTDGNGDALSYFWDFGDGTVLADSKTVSKYWTVGGTYPVNLTVSDRKGGKLPLSLSVTVTDPAGSWTTQTSPTTGSIHDIAANATTAVAVADKAGSGALVMSSSDGATWTAQSIPSSLNVYLRGVAWTGSLFLAVGQDHDSSVPQWRGVIYSSPDGTTWTRRYFGGEELLDVATSGSVHVAVGVKGFMVRSTDGISWSPVSSGSTNRLAGIAFGAGTFVSVGHTTTPPPTFNGNVSILRSSTGTTWTDASIGAGIEGWQDFRSIAWLNNRFVTSGWYSGVKHSIDAGLSWQLEGQDLITLQSPGLAYGNGVFLAAGNESGDNTDYDYISTAGDEWTASPELGIPNRMGATFFKNTFITVGASGSIRQSAVVNQPSGWPFWRLANFPSLSGGSGFTDDPDGDGFRNLVEYALGTNPNAASSKPSITNSLAGGFLTLTIPRISKPGDLLQKVEASTDLVNWTTTGVTVLTDTTTELKARVPVSAATRRYLRLNVETGAQ